MLAFRRHLLYIGFNAKIIISQSAGYFFCIEDPFLTLNTLANFTTVFISLCTMFLSPDCRQFWRYPFWCIVWFNMIQSSHFFSNHICLVEDFLQVAFTSKWWLITVTIRTNQLIHEVDKAASNIHIASFQLQYFTFPR